MVFLKKIDRTAQAIGARASVLTITLSKINKSLKYYQGTLRYKEVFMRQSSMLITLEPAFKIDRPALAYDTLFFIYKMVKRMS